MKSSPADPTIEMNVSGCCGNLQSRLSTAREEIATREGYSERYQQQLADRRNLFFTDQHQWDTHTRQIIDTTRKYARSHQKSGTARLLCTAGLLRLDVDAAASGTAVVMVANMNQQNVQQLFEAISSGSDDAISSAIVDLEYDEPATFGGGIPDSVFDCLTRACEASAGRASGSLSCCVLVRPLVQQVH